MDISPVMERTGTIRAPAAPPRLRVSVIQGLGLSVNGQALVLPNRRGRAMLAVLALDAGQALRRDRLAGLFWGESGEKQARSSVRQTLHEVREALSARDCQVLDSGRDEIRLIDAAVDTDVETVLHDIAARRLPDLPLGSAWIESMLAGYADISPEFRDWIFSARRLTQDRIMRALEGAYRDAALPDRARRSFAETALRIDPVNEEACRSAMRFAAAAGETGVALRAYAALYEAMGLHLDMEPSEATQALVSDIKLGRIEAAVPAPVAAPEAAVTPPTRDVPIILVMPLRFLGGDGTAAWIADAMTEDLVRALACLREPAVVSMASVRQMLQRGDPRADLAGTLGARYVAYGSVRMAGGAGRVAIELSDARTGGVIWSDRHDFSPGMMFETLEHLAGSIGSALGSHIGERELRWSLGRPPSELGTYHLLLQARDLSARLEPSALDRAGRLIVGAIERDPEYASAYAAKAHVHGLRLFQGWSPDAAGEASAVIESARQAVGLDPRYARALSLLGHNMMMARHRYDEALELLDRAIAAAPSDADVLINATPTFAYAGRPDVALGHAERAMALSPEDPFRFRFEHIRSLAHYVNEDPEQAAYWGLRSWRSQPNYTSNLRISILALSSLRRYEEAAPLVERYRQLNPSVRAADTMKNSKFQSHAQRAHAMELLRAAGVP